MTLTVATPTPGSRATTVTVVAFVAHARLVPSVQREAFAEQLANIEPSSGSIVIHTCHRAELYLAPASYGDGPLPELPTGGERLEDVDAARHLISVACGLDSAVIGEDQILHQLRETITERHAELPLDPVLERLFQVALHAGRRAHAWFAGPPRSLADVALDRITRDSGPLEDRTILVVGAGRMGRLAVFAAHRRGARLIVMNRTDERASALAAEVCGTAIPFGTDDVVPQVDGVVVALSGAWRVGPRDAARLTASGAGVVDLSSPPAVSAELQAALGDRFVSVDDLAETPEAEPHERLRRRLESLVSETGRDYCQWLRTRDAVPAIQAMAAMAEGRRREELDWLLRRMSDLSADDRDLIEQMTHRLAAGILHAPFAALNADTNGDLERAARNLFEL